MKKSMAANNGEIDKQQLYGRYQAGEDWRQKLHKKLSHKSLDIPEDDGLNVRNTTTNGFGWKEIVALGALGLGGAGLYQVNQVNQQPPAAAPTAASSAGPVDSAYEIRFYDRDGNLIDVPRLPHR